MMPPLVKALILLFVIASLVSMVHCSCEDIDDPQYPSLCHEILQSLQQALINDKGNLYRSRKAFFYAANADPILLRVEYNITFADNITEDMLPYCITGNSTVETAIPSNQTSVIRGWTSTGLYLLIEPLVLSYAQMTLPLAVLRLVHGVRLRKKLKRSNPEVNTFLWNGSNDLPTLLINLHVTSLPCIPSEEIFNSTIDDLTAHVSNQHGMQCQGCS